MKFVIHRSKDDRFYWTVVGGNGEVMAQSQMMQAKASCLSSIESIMKNAAGAHNRRQDGRGQLAPALGSGRLEGTEVTNLLAAMS